METMIGLINILVVMLFVVGILVVFVKIVMKLIGGFKK
jgi:hypothetical protein